MKSTINLDISNQIATFTFNRPKQFNAITAADYDFLANKLREVDQREDVTVTIFQGNGKFFCAGTDVKHRPVATQDETEPSGALRNALRSSVVGTTIDVGNALYTHSKILVAALNGPVMGIMAAFLGYFDFIYALPGAWLSCPFTFLGMVAEGGASVSFVNRMGLATAKEVLIWGKKKEAQELLAAGFINKLYPEQDVESFQNVVRKDILRELDGLDHAAILTMKSLIQAGLHEKNNMDAVNLREGYAQARCIGSGKPAQQFARIAAKEIKHKL